MPTVCNEIVTPDEPSILRFDFRPVPPSMKKKKREEAKVLGRSAIGSHLQRPRWPPGLSNGINIEMNSFASHYLSCLSIQLCTLAVASHNRTSIFSLRKCWFLLIIYECPDWKCFSFTHLKYVKRLAILNNSITLNCAVLLVNVVSTDQSVFNSAHSELYWQQYVNFK